MDSEKDFKINNLINGYNKYSGYLFDFQKHIEKCCNNNIINTKDRNNYIRIINDIVRQLNTTYNLAIIDVYDKYDKVEETKLLPTDIMRNTELLHIHKVLGINRINDPFSEISKVLLTKIAPNIGFPNISTCLSLVIDDQYKYITLQSDGANWFIIAKG